MTAFCSPKTFRAIWIGQADPVTRYPTIFQVFSWKQQARRISACACAMLEMPTYCCGGYVRICSASRNCCGGYVRIYIASRNCAHRMCRSVEYTGKRCGKGDFVRSSSSERLVLSFYSSSSSSYVGFLITLFTAAAFQIELSKACAYISPRSSEQPWSYECRRSDSSTTTSQLQECPLLTTKCAPSRWS